MSTRRRSAAFAISVCAVLLAACPAKESTDAPAAEGSATAAPTSEASAAQDRAAQSDLRLALVAAKFHFIDHDSYAGFDVQTATKLEPALRWTAAGEIPDGDGAVDIAGLNSDEIVLLADSDSGAAFCIADSLRQNEMVRGILEEEAVTTWNECAALEDW